jgi:flavodoxin
MSNGKTAIVYFSLTGTTENAARQIQKRVPGSTLIRLEPQQAYGDYDSAVRRGDTERRQNIHPALKSVPDLSSY